MPTEAGAQLWAPSVKIRTVDDPAVGAGRDDRLAVGPDVRERQLGAERVRSDPGQALVGRVCRAQ